MAIDLLTDKQRLEREALAQALDRAKRVARPAALLDPLAECGRTGHFAPGPLGRVARCGRGQECAREVRRLRTWSGACWPVLFVLAHYRHTGAELLDLGAR